MQTIETKTDMLYTVHRGSIVSYIGSLVAFRVLDIFPDMAGGNHTVWIKALDSGREHVTDISNLVTEG